MSNVISMRAFKAAKTDNSAELAYQAKILDMSMVQLLEEMVRFQDERKALGTLTPWLTKKGLHLFRALEEEASSKELKILARSYRRHLEYEIISLKEQQ